MFAFSALCMALIGVCIAVPLESPLSDQASPMLVDQELSAFIQPAGQPDPFIQPADQSEPFIQPADQSEPIPNLEPINMELPSPDVVEYFDSRIVGGSDAPDTKHMVALVIGWNMKSFYCGASLISPRHVLTAAHCIIKDWIHGHLLESFHGIVGSNTWNSGGTVVVFISHLEHPEYNAAAIKNDCAVIKTEEVKLNHLIQPIRLEDKAVGGGVPCYATGWGANEVWGGATDLLQILFVSTISEEKCLKLINNVVGHGIAPPIDFKVEICAFHSRGHGMCFGDSGSALVSIKNKRQIGIVSWGFACAVGAPDVYVNVPAMGPFIKSAVLKL